MLQPIDNLQNQADDFLVDHHIKKRKFNFGRWLAMAIIVILVLILVLVVPVVYQGIKVFKSAVNANAQVDVMTEAAKKGNWQELENSLNYLNQDIDQINSSLGGLGIIYYWPSIRKSTDVSRKILSSASSLVAGYREAFDLLTNIENNLEIENLVLSFNDDQARKNVLKIISDYQEKFLAVKNKIDQARAELENINTNDYTGVFKDQLILADDALTKIITSTEIALPILANLPDLMGYGDEKTYLLVFQNNMELRPTGGFIGSYGLIKVKDGEITNMATDDIYNLDKYSIGKLNTPAPEPMKKYNAQEFWYLRDANWSPDWPTSAEKITWFFNEERKNAGLPVPELDGVIAINPDFIANLLAVMGPIVAQGLTFQSENFTTELEDFVEFDYVNYGIAKENRKDIIGVLTALIINNIYDASSEDLLDIWLAFKNNIDKKNILVYLTDSKLQQYFYDRNWSGEVKNPDSDYLMIVDSSLASLKTDQVMERKIERHLRVDDEGNLLATVKITYNHLGQKLTDLITRYRTYVRIYVPQDTWFTKGWVEFTGKNMDLNFTNDVNFGEELNKKYLATFLVIEPGNSKTLVLEYRLPEQIKQQYQMGVYKLLVQKQPGTTGHDLKIYLNFNQRIQNYHADDLPQEFKPETISWQSDLRVDREYLIKF